MIEREQKVAQREEAVRRSKHLNKFNKELWEILKELREKMLMQMLQKEGDKEKKVAAQTMGKTPQMKMPPSAAKSNGD